jgi:hypothetical protein
MYNPFQLPPHVLEQQSKLIKEMIKYNPHEEYKRAVLHLPFEECIMPDNIRQIKQDIDPEEFQHVFLNPTDIDNADMNPLEVLVNRRMRRVEQAKRRRLSRY